MPDHSQVTSLLQEIASGNEDARNRLFHLVYDELHRKAARLVGRERSRLTMQPTALVHEAYLKLFVGRPLAVPHRVYFFCAAANAMRQVLVDHARKKKVRPEGHREPLDDVLDAFQMTHRIDTLDLHVALEELKGLHARQADVVTLRFFGGLRWDDIGLYLNISPSTAEKDWQSARAWLYGRLKEGYDA